MKGRSLSRRRGWGFRSGGGSPHKAWILTQVVKSERVRAETGFGQAFYNKERLGLKMKILGERESGFLGEQNPGFLQSSSGVGPEVACDDDNVGKELDC